MTCATKPACLLLPATRSTAWPVSDFTADFRSAAGSAGEEEQPDGVAQVPVGVLAVDTKKAGLRSCFSLGAFWCFRPRADLERSFRFRRSQPAFRTFAAHAKLGNCLMVASRPPTDIWHKSVRYSYAGITAREGRFKMKLRRSILQISQSADAPQSRCCEPGTNALATFLLMLFYRHLLKTTR